MLLIEFIAHECQGQSICTKTTGSSDSVHEVSIVWVVETALLDHGHIVIDHDIDLRHIYTSGKDIGGDQCRVHSLSEVINQFISFRDLHATHQDFGFNSLHLKPALQLHC